ncbi:MAG: hypothetical protein KDH88_14060 [Chromatiales bacterium]|nr:hypothetical protein [Chromatiales bacterium]
MQPNRYYVVLFAALSLPSAAEAFFCFNFGFGSGGGARHHAGAYPPPPPAYYRAPMNPIPGAHWYPAAQPYQLTTEPLPNSPVGSEALYTTDSAPIPGPWRPRNDP